MRKLFGLFLVCGVRAARRWPPPFSWDKIPLFAHTCNVSGPLSDTAVKTLSRFPMVTIEKAQGLYQQHDARSAEERIISELGRIENATRVFYYNSVLDWPYYGLHDLLAAEEARGSEVWARDSNGSVCSMHGDPGFPNSSDLRVFDMGSSLARKLWIEECVNATDAGVVDGCFSDRATGNPRCDLEDPDGYRRGHVLSQDELGRRANVIANEACALDDHRDDDSGVELRVQAAMIESFAATEQSILDLMSCKIELIQAHYYSDYACSEEPTDVLAAFLIAARKYTYFACSVGWTTDTDPVEWYDWYDRPLGEPMEDASKVGGLWTRRFSSGTVVTFNTTDNRGSIIVYP